MQEQNAMKKSPNAKGIASLTKQYQKLQRKLQRAFSTGRFQSYSQYKQQSLLNRLLGYTSQLKKLGLAAAVCTGMAVATPAVGQINWLTNTGAANPIDGKGTSNRSYTFVDMDGDGDMDLVADSSVVVGYYTYDFPSQYYENTGTAAAPVFTAATSPFDTTDMLNPTFVDVDGDGDMDCFASAVRYDYYGTPTKMQGTPLTYFENTGTATSPTFVERLGTANPLDSVNSFGIPSYSLATSFADIDGDNDLDAFVMTAQLASGDPIIYYENTGTATAPVFLRNDNANPFSSFSVLTAFFGGSIQFADMDGDSDLDALFPRNRYYENTGTISSPTFVKRQGAANPFNNIINDIKYYPNLVDIDNDGDLDVFAKASNNVRKFFENLTLTNVEKIAGSQLNLAISPNPTTGLIQLSEILSGEIMIYNGIGQLVHTQVLEEAQEINLEELNNGIYFLQVQTTEGWMREKIVLQK